jgi:adenylate cyclase
MRSYELEKLKTVGDSYMVAGGLSRGDASHPVDTILAAFEIIATVRKRAEEESVALGVRVGLHTQGRWRLASWGSTSSPSTSGVIP